MTVGGATGSEDDGAVDCRSGDGAGLSRWVMGGLWIDRWTWSGGGGVGAS